MQPNATNSHNPLVIGIAGCSGSGKTTLAARARHAARSHALPARPLLPRPLAVPSRLAPQTQLRPPRLARIRTHHRARPRPRQRRSQSSARSTTSRPTRASLTPSTPLRPARVVIVEGILALHYPELVPLYHFSIYVNAPHDVCLARRIHRDMRDRGRTEQSVREQFDATARPMADLYVIPSAARASVTVEGTDSLDWSVEQILTRLHHARLMPES